jgi:hypothetical protein
MNGLSASGLADLAGVTEAEVARLVELGILVSRDGADPFLAADEPIRDDELEVVPLLQLGPSTGILDQLWSTRLGRGYAEGIRLIARVEKA